MAVDVVSVVDQMSWLTAPSAGFDHLSPDPRRRRAGRNVEVNQLPARVADEEQHVQRLKADRLHHEQVRRPDALDLVAQECSPALASLPLRTPPSITAYRSVADHDPELEEFTPDALGAPQSVVLRHSSDQLPDFCAQAWPAQPTARPPGPVQTPAPAMPADHRFRLHDPQVTSPPIRPKAPKPHP